MPKEEWGTKRLCPHCTARFYDLQRDPMTCPSCGTEYTAESLTTARGRSMIADKAAARAAETDEVIDDEDLDDGNEAGDLDDDLLDDNDDDDADVSLDDIADVAEPDDE
ncbi:TIGR02300 family protein [Paracoccus luteus]|uniref:TIGR02300 family protein n=1 Tax=Paracoccus luteus TaxID=2508543 RepID=UPI0010705672|nr:TIGR02300 family protein [Paracoccus luteus]